MLHFIIGRSGSGKTTRLCAEAAAALARGRRVFLIVPEQQAVDTEQRMADLIGDAPSLCLEVLNFKRLCNRVFREYGGLSYHYITESGRSLILWRAMTELAGQLLDYPALPKKDSGRIAELLGCINEFKAYGISPVQLERSAKLLDQIGAETPEASLAARSKKLRDRLYDLSLIYADYTALISENRDDPSDDLTKAADLLTKNEFFAGAEVFLDSFNGFTPQEFDIIRQLMRQSDNLTISLCYDPSGVEPFGNILSTANRLKSIAESCRIEFDETILTENRRTVKPELVYLERTLWSLDLGSSTAFEGTPEAVRLIACPNLYAECEAVAADIVKKVRAGASYRDFTVTMRGSGRYEGVIDVILEKYGIPFFFSKRTDITAKPLIKLILAAFTIKSGNYRTSDVISYIKTGLSGLTPDEACELEAYAETWSVRGASRWNRDFRMNPRGFVPGELTETDAGFLRRVNDARAHVMRPLTAFYEKLDSCQTIADYSKALYDFLLALEIPEKLGVLSERLATEGETAEAAELSQLWGILIDALDELWSSLGDLEADGDTYVKLMNLIFAGTDIGRIPGSIDEVVVGDASLLRANRKHVYVIGANEGIFPQSPEPDSVFGDLDRELLAAVGIELAGGVESQSADERFTFYRALVSASDSLTVIWSVSDLSGKAMRPSLGAIRLHTLFPELTVLEYAQLPLVDRLEGKQNLPEYLAEAEGTPLGDAIADYCTGDPELAKMRDMQKLPLSEDDTLLGDETNHQLASGNLALTQSRLDSYVLCHFSYYCKYVLKLGKSENASFNAADIGTFVHHILELFVARVSENGRMDTITDDEIEAIVDEITAAYLTDLCGAAPEVNMNRLAHLFTKLKRSSRLLCRNIADEFGQSEFTPAFFELPIRFTEGVGGAVDPLEVPLDDGTNAYIYGIADRVDILRRSDKLYVRVIDYKTGSKEFSLDDIALGLNLQMLLYLFSLWKNGSRPDNALNKLADGTEVLPAGVLYFSAGVPTITLDAQTSPVKVGELVAEHLSRHGLLLDDEAVLRAMETELSGKYLPVKLKKNGEFAKSDALKSLADFGGLLTDIEKTIRKIGSEIKRGNASAHPMKNKRHDACEYCEMKPVCRRFDD